MTTTSGDIVRHQVGGGDPVTLVRVEAVDRHGGGAVAVLTLSPVSGEPLPAWTPGSHVDVDLPNGIRRQYSLCGDVDAPVWRLGVLREADSRGGSAYVHDGLRAGDVVGIHGPRNNFALVDGDAYVFVAGGIGITPFLPMIAEVQRRGRPWRLVYGGRTRAAMAFLDELVPHGDRVAVHPQDEAGHIDVAGISAGLTAGTVVYCCGPEPLLDAMEHAMAGHPAGTLHVERFRPKEGLLDQDRRPFEVHLDHTGLTVQVGADQTIAEALDDAGVDVVTSCREGTCGTCETPVLDGIPDHRDSYLSAAEQASGETMMICCSRACTPRLVLDL